MTSGLSRFGLVLSALRQAGELSRHDHWAAADLAEYQARRLDALVAHARLRSPFYRERLQHLPQGPVALSQIPPLDKATMMAHFDELVTDRAVRRADVERHLDGPDAARAFLGRYEVMCTGGSSGERGIFLYGREEVRHALAGVLRVNAAMHGLGPRLPRRKIAMVMARSATHMTARFGALLDVGVHRFLRLDARAALPDLVSALNAYQPTVLSAYASIAAMLAEEQLAGRLTLRLDAVQTSSEVRTPLMTERITKAFGCLPFDAYASTETCVLAAECEAHRGMHVLADQTLVEVVDERNEPVPPGHPGARVLVTSLESRTQPLLRYALTDLVTLSTEPCPCGRPFPLIISLDGRSDDVLHLPRIGGGTVAVHPLTLRSPLGQLAGVRQYRVVYDASGLTVEAVASEGVDPQSAIEVNLDRVLRAQSVEPPRIRVRIVHAIERHGVSGKVRLVESRLPARAPTALEDSPKPRPDI